MAFNDTVQNDPGPLADSYGCSAWRPRSRGEPDKLGWACFVRVCVCVCLCARRCVRRFLTRRRQYCIFHSSCRLIGCDMCLRRAAPSSLPITSPLHPLSPLFSFHLFSSPLSLFFFLIPVNKKEEFFPQKKGKVCFCEQRYNGTARLKTF